MKKSKLLLLSICAFSLSLKAQLSFAPKVDYSAGANPYSVFSADFNGDGKKD
jgi:hypothetical protein